MSSKSYPSNFHLIIAEKPSVAKTIANAVASRLNVKLIRNDGYIQAGNYILSWCYGHLLELLKPNEYGIEKWKKWDLDNLPIFPDKFVWKVQDKGDIKAHFNHLSKLIQNATSIIHAGDPDREGQIIVDELFYYMNLNQQKLSTIGRMIITDLSESGINKALDSITANSNYNALYQSALGRQTADWLLGMNLTQAVTSLAQKSGYYGKALSIGRVFTPLLAMVYKRDLEIENFVPHDFYNLFVKVKPVGNPLVQVSHSGINDPNKNIVAKLDLLKTFERWYPDKYNAKNKAKIADLINDQLLSQAVDEEGRIVNSNFISWVIQQIEHSYANVTNFTTVTTNQSAPLGYSLSDLQQAMFNIFKISVDKTLELAQELYEKGLITYPRTDCSYLNDSDFDERLPIINNLASLASQILGLSNINGSNFDRSYKSKIWNSKQVENHSAIIPTSKLCPWASLSADEKKLYQLIAQRYLIQFMPPAQYSTTELVFEFNDKQKPWVFSSKAKTLINPGWKVVTNTSFTQTEQATNQLINNQTVSNRIVNSQTVNSQIIDTDEYDLGKNQALKDTSNSTERSINSMISNQTISALVIGDTLEYLDYFVATSKTTPPARFNEATLLSAMTHIGRYVQSPELKAILNETDGLGTEATRAATIKKLFDFNYCYKQEQSIISSDLGRALIEVLPSTLTTPDTTAIWEKSLSNIAKGSYDLNSFINNIKSGIMQVLCDFGQMPNQNFARLASFGQKQASSTSYKNKTTKSSSFYKRKNNNKKSNTSKTSKTSKQAFDLF